MIKKGVILAGGSGTRLRPATKVTNKHLLPIYDCPMIYYPIATLKQAGIEDILIICGPNHAGDFAQLLGGGEEFGVSFTYRVQSESLGIAHALSMAEGFAGNEGIVAILGDNIFEEDLQDQIQSFETGAKIFLKAVDDAKRFGVADIDHAGRVLSIEEKPQNPKSVFAVTGLYIYDNTVFGKIKECQKSARGEYEITDVNNKFIQENAMTSGVIKGHWTDAGTHESFFRATVLARDLKTK